MPAWLAITWAWAMAHWYLGSAAIAGGAITAAALDRWVHRHGR
jgi:hypothetical protein